MSQGADTMHISQDVAPELPRYQFNCGHLASNLDWLREQANRGQMSIDPTQSSAICTVQGLRLIAFKKTSDAMLNNGLYSIFRGISIKTVVRLQSDAL